MEDNLYIMILVALSGAAFGAFFKEFFNFFSSRSTKERINKYKENTKHYKKELKSKTENSSALNDKISELDNKIASLDSEVKKNQKIIWDLLNGKLAYTIEDNSKSKRLMKDLKLAFDYLIFEGVTKINGYESLKSEGTGVNKRGWNALKTAGFFRETKEKEYILSTEGEKIFYFYKQIKNTGQKEF